MDDHKTLLPWYVNHTLNTAENEAVESWLHNSLEAKEEQQYHQLIANSLISQETINPTAHIEKQLLTKIHKPISKPSRIREWSVVFSTGISILILLWTFIRPGNSLTWSLTEVNENNFSISRIYRAPLGSTNFIVVDEIPTEPDQLYFEYSDSYLIPWISYQYYIEFVDPDGNTYISQSIISNSGDLFISRLAIFICYCILALILIVLIRDIFFPANQKSNSYSVSFQQ